MYTVQLCFQLPTHPIYLLHMHHMVKRSEITFFEHRAAVTGLFSTLLFNTCSGLNRLSRFSTTVETFIQSGRRSPCCRGCRQPDRSSRNVIFEENYWPQLKKKFKK
jgi:hypothetical protein